MTMPDYAFTNHKVGTAGKSYNTIGLFDHMGFGNMGDAAIQEAFIANIKKRLPTARLVGFSLNPDDTARRHKIVSHPIKSYYPAGNRSETRPAGESGLKSRLKSFVKQRRALYALARAARRCVNQLVYPTRALQHLVRSYIIIRSLDALVMAGGGQLCELWRDLPYNVFTFCLLAKIANTPILIVGLGAGPLTRPWNKLFAKWAVQLANYISFRDVESQALLRNLGARAETNVCPDPAYSLDLGNYANARVPTTSLHTVGLNPMGFCDPRIWPRKDESVYCCYLEKVAAFTAWLLAQNYNVEIFTSDIIVDRYAILDLEHRVLANICSFSTATVTVRPVSTLEELLCQMSTFEVVITSKFHGVVFSHLLAKPVIALSYHCKIDDLMRTVGHQEYCMNIEQFEVRSLIDTFMSLVRNSDNLKALFGKTTATYAESLRAEFDHLFVATNC
jgi:polysaccharide pyruvyl transferase WcaK-like protein